MTNFEKFSILMLVLIVILLALIGIAKVTEDIFIEKNGTLHLTQNSQFVVENVRADTTGWKYELENLNLTASPNLSTLIVQTDNPIGYAVGDTLSLIQHKNLQQ